MALAVLAISNNTSHANEVPIGNFNESAGVDWALKTPNDVESLRRLLALDNVDCLRNPVVNLSGPRPYCHNGSFPFSVNRAVVDLTIVGTWSAQSAPSSEQIAVTEPTSILLLATSIVGLTVLLRRLRRKRAEVPEDL